MNNTTKGTLAVLAGITLLLGGGGTFALWSDSVTAEGGTITSGNLAVAFLDEPIWEDVSYGREIQEIEIDEFRMVPGDTIEGVYEIDAALQGENMLADLTFAVDGAPVGDADELWEGLDITYTVRDANFDLIRGLTSLQLGTPATLALRSAGNGDGTGRDPSTLPPSLDDKADFTIFVTATLPEETKDRNYAQAQMLLKDLGVQLTQSRNQPE